MFHEALNGLLKSPGSGQVQRTMFVSVTQALSASSSSSSSSSAAAAAAALSLAINLKILITVRLSGNIQAAHLYRLHSIMYQTIGLMGYIGLLGNGLSDLTGYWTIGLTDKGFSGPI